MTAQDLQHDQTGQSILAILQNAASTGTIQEVLEVLQRLDAALSPRDGVKWFNLLYVMVTRAVYGKPASGSWADERWLTQLDVFFARLYFDALSRSYTNPASVPRAWAALFESRYAGDIMRAQFALAGMNAHINHDLPLALVQTGEALDITPARGTPEYRDYETVNGIIDGLEPGALQYLATGIVGEVAEDLNCLGRVLSNWNVIAARDTAWTNAEVLWQVRDLPPARDGLLLSLDRLTGFAGRGLLVPV
ncbi:MAG: hypothetical protein JOZ41_14580 [Chloroflexi bacterium]|nr:hypothetical protein [Chloroflexota bacterium]